MTFHRCYTCSDLTYGCSVKVEGSLQASGSAAQSEDLVATSIEVLGPVEKDVSNANILIIRRCM